MIKKFSENQELKDCIKKAFLAGVKEDPELPYKMGWCPNEDYEGFSEFDGI